MALQVKDYVQHDIFVDEVKNTLAHYALYKKSFWATKILVEKGFGFNAINMKNAPPL